MLFEEPFSLRRYWNFAYRDHGSIGTMKDRRSNINEASVSWQKLRNLALSGRNVSIGEGVAACPGNRCPDLVAM